MAAVAEPTSLPRAGEEEAAAPQLQLAALPLAAAFDRALQLSALGDGDGSSTARAPQRAVELAALLEHCEACVQRGGLFSANEDQEDLTTSSMRYLLLPFLKAELLSGVQQPERRAAALSAAASAYAAFLQRCSQYGLLGPAAGAEYAAAEGGGGPPDLGAARTRKIERFKRSRALAGLLQQLQARRRAGDEEAGVEGGAPGGVGGWDEEDERRLWQTQLEAAAIKALDAAPLLQQELQLLQHAAAAQQQPQEQQGSSTSEWRRQAAADTRRQPQQQLDPQQRAEAQQAMLGRLTDIAGQLSLGGDRQAMRQQVFRPSHILPTLTVEQQGEIELAAAREREAAEAAAKAKAAARAAQARSDDEDDDAVAAARAWDDFADDNPRGWGNSKLRPCA